jgi:SAM-dependent methyltransferase
VPIATETPSRVAELVDRIKSTSPYRAVRAAKGQLERLAFERGDFADTAEKVDLDEFELAHPERTDYEPSAWGFARRALRRLEITEDDVFLDIGSGKGRVVWQAAQHPFARVIGVELSRELNAVARQNIERNGRRLVCREVQLVTADASAYEIPDDVTVIYMFAPFRGRIFRAVTANILASIDRTPRPLTLIYANPVMDEHLQETGRFELVEVLKGVRPDADSTSWVHLYTARPLPGRATAAT